MGGRGLAAHWAYKAQEGIDPTEVGASQSLMEDLRDILDNAETSEEVVEHTKLDLFQDQVFCFSPKGDLIRLPKGANAIDFAYAVHSAVGNRCVGAKINNSIRNLRTPLRNGDQVEILTSKNAHPNPEWENIALTSKAKAAIRRYRRQMERDSIFALVGDCWIGIWKVKSFRPVNAPWARPLISWGAAVQTTFWSASVQVL